MLHDDTHHTLINGITGVAASCLGVLSTFQEQFEWWLRITGGMIGVAIGAITLCNLICKRVQAYRAKRK